MRLGRIAHPAGLAFVAVEGDLDSPDDLIAREIKDHPFGNPEFTGRSWLLADVRVLAPILSSKVIGVGRNYADHAAELGNSLPDEPIIFLKPPSSVIGPNATILLPPSSARVDFEGELAVVIGRPARDIKAENAASVILGYTIANDVTARDLQKLDVQFTRGKGFDSFCPLGPWIDTDVDPSDLRITTELDGDVVQDGHTSDMVHSVGAIIEFVSEIMTLMPGDVILTGTPAGVGPMEAGQTVTVRIEGLGALSNPVAYRQ
ncbi:FAA hydrolase family protein [Nakamurella antarctica]|uniref:FAA hydrolase family protein n=1 Tax=Nakamurella antarctica TaxID=1902245 RepID=A0A3G8ZNW2_9ACTN|nr:fumarylacetoacetate hydrolase family protein [Nakamurella antarctica]AZI58475.1 FAA hydrolase family protein [Nakamurella antarctica]